MHISDSLLSLETGLVYAAVSAAAVVIASRQLEQNRQKLPLAAVMAAFIFAAQMINFSIPGTGGSGHLGGGLLLASLLGPPAALLSMSAVLTVQALFFADGGILALGVNIFNLGLIPAYLIYPLFRNLIDNRRSGTFFLFSAALIAVVAGSLSMVFQLLLSGVLALNVQQFLMLAVPMHIFIGIGEGLITVAAAAFIHTSAADTLPGHADGKNAFTGVASLVLLTLLTAGFLSIYASSDPDGLEWSLEKGGIEDIQEESALHRMAGNVQERTSLFPDYSFPAENRESVEAGPSLPGILGSFIVFAVLLMILLASTLVNRSKSSP